MKSISRFAFLLLAAGPLVAAQQVPTPIFSGIGRLIFAKIAPHETQTVEIPEAPTKNKSAVACTPLGGSLGPEFLWSSRVTAKGGVAITVGNISNTASTPGALSWTCAIYRVD